LGKLRKGKHSVETTRLASLVPLEQTKRDLLVLPSLVLPSVIQAKVRGAKVREAKVRELFSSHLFRREEKEEKKQVKKS
jgi:hypothetical protein